MILDCGRGRSGKGRSREIILRFVARIQERDDADWVKCTAEEMLRREESRLCGNFRLNE